MSDRKPVEIRVPRLVAGKLPEGMTRSKCCRCGVAVQLDAGRVALVRELRHKPICDECCLASARATVWTPRKPRRRPS